MRDIDLDAKARAAADKPSAIGPDIDFKDFTDAPVEHAPMEDLTQLPKEDQLRLLDAGVDVTGKGRSGSFLQMDGAVVHSQNTVEGVEVMPIRQALEKYDWLADYYFRLVDVDKDKFTAKARLDLQDGYMIRALPGAKITDPVQSCLYLAKESFNQNVHNIIIAEEDSELHIITGCATAAHVHSGLHVGISEFYVKKNAKLSFTMIHHWAENMAVRPRSAGMVEEGGVFLSNYVSMKPVKSLQMYPTTHLVGRGATARFYSILAGNPGSELDVGGRVILSAPETRAEVVSRAITNGGRIIARGQLVGEVPGIKAHLECSGLILNGGVIEAIPELTGKAEGVEMSHEAAVGKIAEEAVLYLMSRGVSEEEATSSIVRGFLNVDIPGLPPGLKAQMDRAVELSENDMM